jgi:hypothetical protein
MKILAPRAQRIFAPTASSYLEWIARAGLAAKGFVYFVMGALAVWLALDGGGGGETTDPQGALTAVQGQPFGQALLVALALGLFAYAAWKIVEAYKDPDRLGSNMKGLMSRTAMVLNGLAHGFLAVYAVHLLNGGGGRSGEEETLTWSARLMEQPFGPWLVGLVGLGILFAAALELRCAWREPFMDRLRRSPMEPAVRQWIRRLGKAGYGARGVVFALMGVFFLYAAIQADPSEVRGLEGALDALLEQPYGPWLLGVVAAGVVAYGVFLFALARYRPIRI